jgi:hypothetical protein
MKKIILSICCVAALVACKKTAGPEGPQGPAGPSGTASTGTITGKVSQYDEYGLQYTNNLNTTTVSIEGKDNSTVTDAQGNYTLSNVSPGIVNISYVKTGAGLSKTTQVSFPGNGTLFLNNSVGDKPTFVFTGGSIKDSIFASKPSIKVDLTFAPNSKAREGVIIFGKTVDLDISDPSSYSLVYSIQLQANSSFFSSFFQITGTNFNSFENGSTFYAKIYPKGVYESGYQDYISNKKVITNYGKPLETIFPLTKR